MEKGRSISTPSALDVLIIILEYWKEILGISLFGAALGGVVWYFTPSLHSAELVVDARGELLKTLENGELLAARLRAGAGANAPVDLTGVRLTVTALAPPRQRITITSEDAQRVVDVAEGSIATLVPLALPSPSRRPAIELERQGLGADLRAMQSIYSSLQDYLAGLAETTDSTRNVEDVARAMRVVRDDIGELQQKIRPLDLELAPATRDTVIVAATPPVATRPNAGRIVAGGAAVGALLALIVVLVRAATRAAGRDPGSVEAWRRLKAAVLSRKLFR